MAKITVTGDALVITSTLSIEDIKTCEKYAPRALTVYEADEDGKKQAVYSVATCDNDGGINEYGAIFGRETRGEDKKAAITILLDKSVGDKVFDYVADTYGRALQLLEQVEAQVPAALTEVAAFKDGLRDKITLA